MLIEKVVLLANVAGHPTHGKAIVRPFGIGTVEVGGSTVAHQKRLAVVIEVEIGVFCYVIAIYLIHLFLVITVFQVFRHGVSGACEDADLGSALDL